MKSLIWITVFLLVLVLALTGIWLFRRGGFPLRANAMLLQLTYRQARRAVILILGCSVVLVGIAMIFLPGPAVVVIPLGLAILAVEFEWARRLLKKAGEGVLAAKNGMMKNRGKEGI